MPVVIGLMTMALLGALGGAMAIGTIAETAIAAAHREGIEAFYATEAAVEFVEAELADAEDWDAVASGAMTSMFVDGPLAEIRRVGAVTVDLTQATADVNEEAGDSLYRLYAFGRLADLVPPMPTSSQLYVVVWVAELSDGVLGIVGRAYGPTGSRRSIAVSVTKIPPPDEASSGGVKVLSWHELQ